MAGTRHWIAGALALGLAVGCSGGGERRASPFEMPVNFPAGKKPAALVTYDMNADGYPDLLVPNAEGDTVRFFEGVGDGTFKNAVVMKAGREPIALAVNDFNGDGLGDIAVCNYGDGDVLVILGQKDGMFKTRDRFSTGRLPIAAVSADFNRDGFADLAVSLRFDKLVIHLGAGDGSFKMGETYHSGGTPSHMVTGDFNNDGSPDIAIASNAVEAHAINVFLGNGDGTFQAPRHYEGGKQSNFITSGDINQDGNLDLLVVSPLADSMTLFLGDGKGGFTTVPDFAGEKGPRFAIIGDFNHDKVPDIVVTNERDNSISILEGQGDGTFAFPHYNYPTGPAPKDLVGADFNNDGLMDLAMLLHQRELIEVFVRSRGGPAN